MSQEKVLLVIANYCKQRLEEGKDRRYSPPNTMSTARSFTLEISASGYGSSDSSNIPILLRKRAMGSKGAFRSRGGPPYTRARN